MMGQYSRKKSVDNDHPLWHNPSLLMLKVEVNGVSKTKGSAPLFASGPHKVLCPTVPLMIAEKSMRRNITI